MSTRFSIPPDAQARMKMLSDLLTRPRETQQRELNSRSRNPAALQSSLDGKGIGTSTEDTVSRHAVPFATARQRKRLQAKAG
jgi:hypothetical protein